MTIALTPETEIEQEHYWINLLLKHDLELCHIRKHGLDDEAMYNYVGGIEPRYRKRLVLHSHFHLAHEFGIGRLHFPEKARLKKHHLAFQTDYTCSTSVHAIADFNTLGSVWSYAFLSPVYPSISKPGYGEEWNVLREFSGKQHDTVKLIALGGIHPQNYRDAYSAGADGVALMGAIWQNSNPLTVFLKCRKKDQ